MLIFEQGKYLMILSYLAQMDWFLFLRVQFMKILSKLTVRVLEEYKLYDSYV